MVLTPYEKFINLDAVGGDYLEDPLIKCEYIKGRAFNYEGKVSLRITGVQLESDSLFQGDCFSSDCFDGGGIWTTAVTSDVSRVVDNVTEYWIPGSIDKEGNLWIVDIGIVYPNIAETVILERNIPILTTNIVTSTISLPIGIKIAVIKKITPSSVVPVIYKYGDYRLSDNLIRSQVKPLLNYNYTDQLTNLEDIALGILSLIHCDYRYEDPNSIYFYTKGEIDIGINKLVNKNLNKLYSLIDLVSISNRRHSIPNKLATYSTYSDIYSKKADNEYKYPFIRVFEEECFEEGCFEVKANNLLISREVSTRAIAWLIYALLTYSYSWDTRYKEFLNYLVNYLIRQIDPASNLPSKGWTHSTTLSNSVEIKEYELSTAVVVCIVFSKLYQLEGDKQYLDKSADIYEAIINKLYSYKSNSFKDSLTTQSSNSLENIVYSLIFSLFFKRVDIAEPLLNKLNSLLKNEYGVVKEIPILNQSGNYTYDLEGNVLYTLSNYLEDKYLETNPNILNFTNLISNNDSLSKHLTLLTLAIELGQSLNIENSLSNSYKNIFRDSINTTYRYNSIFQITEAIKPQILSHSDISYLPVRDMENLLFNRSYLFNKIKSIIPVNFGWFSNESINQGNLSKLLYSISKLLSINSTEANRLYKSYREDDIIYRIINKGREVGFNLLKQSSISKYKQELSEYISTKNFSTTEQGITNRMSRLNVDITIEEPWHKLLTTNNFYISGFSNVIGEGYFSGEDYISAKVIDVSIYRPLDSVIISELNKALPSATKLKVNEVVIIEDVYDVQEDSCFSIFEEDTTTPCLILQEDTNRVLQEVSSNILMEKCDNG